MATRPPRTGKNSDGISTSSGDAGPRRCSLREATLEALEPAERDELISLSPEAFKLHDVYPGRRKRRYLELCNKGWAKVQPRLVTGELIAKGLDPHERSGRPEPIAEERWSHATINYETWAVQNYEVTFVQVEVSAVGGLHISEKPQKARFGAVDLDLEGRAFDVLLTLAKAAKLESDNAMVSNVLLNKKHISANAGPRELPRVIFVIRRALIERAGMSPRDARTLVQNIPNKGYRLNMSPDEIFFDDVAHR